MSDRATCALKITLFGPLDIQRNGVSLLGPGRSKAAWLFGLLVLEHGREVSFDGLAQMLWPEQAVIESDREKALDSVRHCVAHLGNLLGEERERLHKPTKRSVRLDLSSAEVDVLTFDQAIKRGDIPSLERAVALYQGPLLEGCTLAFAGEERERREQQYLQAREAAWRLLMEALMAQGEYTAAAAEYRKWRLLCHEYKTEPSPETKAVLDQIQEAQNRAPSPSVDLLVAPSVRPPGNIPQNYLTRLVGREEEIRQIKTLLRTVRLLTLTGAGGVGKTRLATHVAGEVLEHYHDGAWFIDLAPLTDSRLVPDALASALRMHEESGRPLIETVTDRLRSSQLLLVLDNCEHLLEACARLAETLLRAGPRLRILATSRRALGLIGETTWRVPSLEVPAPEAALELETWTQYAAVRLFVERAGAVRTGLTATRANAPAIAQICRRLDGIPLALELAAARVNVLSVGQIAARLDDRFGLLTGGSQTALPRQQTLQATMDWSYDLLSEAERALLRRLSVFAGGWTLAAAEGVCGKDEGGRMKDEVEEIHPLSFILHPSDILDLLSRLVDQSLVLAEEPNAEMRYRLLETVRQYGRHRLLEAGESEVIQERYFDWCLALAEAAESQLTGPQQVVWLDRLEAEHDNLRAALQWCKAATDRGEPELRLAGALWEFWDIRGYRTEGRGWLEGALDRNRSAVAALRARVLNRAGALALSQSDYRVATAFHEESLALSRQSKDRLGVAASLQHLGMVAYRQTDYGRARALYAESLGMRQEMNDKKGAAAVLGNLGIVAWSQGDLVSARAFFEESLSGYRELKDEGGIAAALGNVGLVALHQADYVSAHTIYEESLALAREVGKKEVLANTLNNLGLVAEKQGDYTRAGLLYEESLAIYRELGHKWNIAASLINGGNVARQQENYTLAGSLYKEGLALVEELGDRYLTACSVEGLAYLWAQQGQPYRAARLFGAAEALRESIGAPLPTNEREEYDRYVAAVHDDLGDEPFVTVWAKGQEMTLEQTIEYALTDEKSFARTRDSLPGRRTSCDRP